MKVLQINFIINSGSHGRIAEEIGKTIIKEGYVSYIAAAHITKTSHSETIQIGHELDRKFHGLKTRLFDRHGFGSKLSTIKLIKTIRKINPDIIHLHNIHGYYLHIGVLFKYLKEVNKPVVWTFHDCWPFTGHCSHFERVNCYKWQNECFSCPNLHSYPASWVIDNSRKNFQRKKKLFTGISKMVLVAPCLWMKNHLKNSFLNEYDVKIIHNGVDLSIFKPSIDTGIREKYNIKKNYILGVANKWSVRKGLDDFKELRKILPPEFEIVLVGLTTRQIKNLPSGIKGVMRTENTAELSALYSGAEVFVNPTYVDNFPSTNLEALACGTPVITYNTGGSPEAINQETGIAVKKGDVSALSKAITDLLDKNRETYRAKCRKRAEEYFDKNKNYKKYLDLYSSLL